MNSLSQWLADAARARDDAGMNRRLVVADDTRSQIDMVGNDYLGLRHDDRVLEVAVAAIEEFGAGTGSPRLLGGSVRVHDELERALADHVGTEAALVFSTGYSANLAALTALADRDTLIVSDAHNHTSIRDAASLADGAVQVVPHGDLDAVADALARRTQPRALIVVESIFSVIGDTADLPALHRLAERHDAWLMVDEGHALGVMGDRGEGVLGSLGLADSGRVVITAGLSKALASQGGAVLGSRMLRHHLVNSAHSFIDDTGLAPASAGSALGALEVLQDEPTLVKQVHVVAARIAAACGAPTPPGPIVSVPVSDLHRALTSVDVCAAHGIRIGCVRPPLSPDDVPRLRLTAHANLTDTDLAFSAQTLRTAVRRG